MVTPPESPVEVDVCVVGAGPVGLALADALVSRGRSVLVLESGGAEPPPDAPPRDDALDGAVTPGGLGPLWTTRTRGVGGTSRLWNTWLDGARTAKYVPLDPVDYEARPGVPHTGWPFGADALAPWIEEACGVCGLDPRAFAPDAARGDAPPLVGGRYAFGLPTPFTEVLPARLVAHPGATLRTDATVVGLESDDGGRRVAGVRWRGASGDPGRARARATVLAAGALENARILLEAAAADPRVPWADAFWVGRGLMEHPIDRALRLDTRHPDLCPRAGFYGPHRGPAAPASGAATETPDFGPWSLGRLAPSAHRLRAQGLPNASIRFTAQPAGAAVLQAPAARSWARRLVPGSALRRRVGDVVRWAGRNARRLRGVEYTLHLDLEQWPDPANRVTLSDEIDGQGRRRIRVEWRWSDADEARRRRLHRAVAADLEAAGLGRVRIEAGVPLDPDAHHHSGTTRMHADPNGGVVDPDLRVHGADGVFVCGSSVFPTAGAINPTLTAVALALRLADHLDGIVLHS